ncbi:hypothetical protein [Kitasatospora sp. NBC_00039]|uniref:hypothetical protein n=1 Tax=Kitasatospora sp. NBC_00039 TaxID=2903565 RepID=UPI00324F9F89
MDLLAFPALAGTVLNEAVRFLFARAGAVLDRRAGRVPVEEPERVAGQPDLFRVRAAELTDERVERIMHAQGALSVYVSRPELLRGDDDGLREVLGRLRRDLEEVYGRGFPFGDEQRPRPGVDVSQQVDQLNGQQVGVRAKGIAEASRVQVIQRANTIEETGEQVGLEIDGAIG